MARWMILLCIAVFFGCAHCQGVYAQEPVAETPVIVAEAVPDLGFKDMGLAWVQPLSGDPGFTRTAASFKFVPVVAPLKIETFGEVVQYVGANLNLDLLIAIDSINGGVSLPLVSATSNELTARVGVAYYRLEGVCWYVKGSIGF